MYTWVIVILLVILLLYFLLRGSENFAPYASILIPDIINSSPSFDAPNQFGDRTNPYQNEKDRSENKLFLQTHALSYK